MNYTEPFLRKVETTQEDQQQHQSEVSYGAAVAAKNTRLLSSSGLSSLASSVFISIR